MNCTKKFLKSVQGGLVLSRELNCWTAAITKTHRKVYERTYPVVVVHPDGSTTNIQYHQPIRIIKLPLDLSTLTEAEKKMRLERRRPKIKVKVVEEIEDDFEPAKYLKIKKR